MDWKRARWGHLLQSVLAETKMGPGRGRRDRKKCMALKHVLCVQRKDLLMMRNEGEGGTRVST